MFRSFGPDFVPFVSYEIYYITLSRVCKTLWHTLRRFAISGASWFTTTVLLFTRIDARQRVFDAFLTYDKPRRRWHGRRGSDRACRAISEVSTVADDEDSEQNALRCVHRWVM